MPSKKKKYNARFPPARIKKIMQTDEEVGKVAAAVPVIISRALELFVESLLQKTSEVTKARNAKTLTTSHMKQCIFGEPNFDFLKELVVSIPDNQEEDNCNSPAPTGEQSNFNLARRAHRPGSSGSRGGAGSSSRSQTQDFSDDDDDIDEDLPDGSDNAIQSPEIKDEPIYLDLTKSDCNDEKPPAIKPERPSVIHPPIIQNFPGFYASNLNQCDDYDT